MACMADFCHFSCISMWFCHLWSEICVKCHFFSVFLTFFCLFLNDFYCDMFFMLFLLVVENVSFTCLFHFKMMNFLAFLGMFLLQINQICTEIYAEYSKNVSVVWNIWNILCESETIHQKCFFPMKNVIIKILIALWLYTVGYDVTNNKRQRDDVMTTTPVSGASSGHSHHVHKVSFIPG